MTRKRKGWRKKKKGVEKTNQVAGEEGKTDIARSKFPLDIGETFRGGSNVNTRFLEIRDGGGGF